MWGVCHCFGTQEFLLVGARLCRAGSVSLQHVLLATLSNSIWLRVTMVWGKLSSWPWFGGSERARSLIFKCFLCVDEEDLGQNC